MTNKSNTTLTPKDRAKVERVVTVGDVLKCLNRHKGCEEEEVETIGISDVLKYLSRHKDCD